MRGDVFRFRHAATTRGREQRGERFGVVVQATRLEHLSTWLVVPTSTSARPYVFRPRVQIGGQESLALCDATAAVDAEQRLGDHAGYLTLAEMSAIDDALRLLFDLDGE